jgi:hypothetical protein
MTINETKQRNGKDVIAAANHFVDPSWNPPFVPAEHSFSAIIISSPRQKRQKDL